VGSEPGRVPEEHTFAAATAVGSLTPVLDRLRGARRVVVLAGQGAQRAAEGVRRLAERLGAPVVTTGSGRGVLAEDHPLAMGYDNARGSVDELNRLLAAADLVLVLGAKLGHNGTAGFRLRLPLDRTVQVDTAAEVLGANYGVVASVAIPVERFLEAASGLELVGGGWPAAEVAGWRERLSARGGKPEPRVGGRSAAEFFRELRAALPRDAVVTTDSGLHQIMTRRHFDVFAPSGLLLPTDFQAMGFGLPAAIAARLANPDRPVVALVGDGGFAMSGLELATAVREGLDLGVVVFNDGYLGQIRMQQIRDFGRASGTGVAGLDYAAFAESVGARYASLDGELGVAAAVRTALSGGVWLLEVTVGESLATTRHRAAGIARRAGRKVVRGRARSFLKALLRKLLRR
jgi:acetolactate synthase-1/2/3 large subunit